MAAGSGDGLDRAAEGWAALTMWLHAAECAALASRTHLLAGSPRRAAASSGRAEAFLEHCNGPRPVGLTMTLAAPTLTRREQEVARLAQTGLSSQAIAERLYLSVRTVDSHLARTYHKLGITSRRELAGALGTWLPTQPKKAS
jgi:DNA-binding NarL/FixJ family response regulator